MSLRPIKALVLALTVLAVGLPACAQVGTESRTDLMCSDWRGEMSSKTTWSILAVGAIGALAVLDHEDPATARRRLDDTIIDVPMELGNFYGSGWGVGMLGAGTLSAGLLAGDPSTRDFGRDVTVSFVASSAVSGLIKHTVDRTRPSGGHYSFPSGHTTAAFSSVAPIWHHGGREAGITATVLATMTGLARMEDHKHYLSDVIAGAALGLAVGRIVVAQTESSVWAMTAGPSGLRLSRAF